MDDKNDIEAGSPRSPSKLDIDMENSIIGGNSTLDVNVKNENIEDEEIMNMDTPTSSENINKQEENVSILTTQTPKKELSSHKILIDIHFRNKKTYFAFHEEFIGVIKKYYKDKLDDLNISDDALSNRICISEKLVKKSDSFLIDTTPNIDFNINSAESTPKYTPFTKIVLSNSKDREEEKPTPGSSSNRCFNCDKGSHSLRNCPEPRNTNKIRKARNEFNRKELRYHADDEIDEFIPGKISDDLKAALGITDNQLPLHVYKMRKFGYPPSWLEEAKIYYSGLQIHEDKVNFNNDVEQFKYDIQKIYDFPGFNVPPSPPFVDKHRLLNLPPMLPGHSKEVLIASLGDYVANGYKRQKLRNSVNINDTSVNGAEEEMDIENDIPHTEDDSPKSPGEVSSNSDHSANVDDLQMEREKLLNALSEINESTSFTETELPDNQQKEGNENENSNQSDLENCKRFGHVETTIFGCPVLPSFSPFESLPEGDKFQDGVCDVIAFENLAESTGKYEKMKGLIKKVRVFVKEHQKE